MTTLLIVVGVLVVLAVVYRIRCSISEVGATSRTGISKPGQIRGSAVRAGLLPRGTVRGRYVRLCLHLPPAP